MCGMSADDLSLLPRVRFNSSLSHSPLHTFPDPIAHLAAPADTPPVASHVSSDSTSTRPLQSGYRAYRTLPRQTFGHLQSRLQPLYFSFSTLTTSALLLTHLWFHPGLISSPRVEPHWTTCEEGHQGLFILAALVPQVLNWLVVGPMASSVMLERHRLERLEGKEYDEPNVSVSACFDFNGLPACIINRGIVILTLRSPPTPWTRPTSASPPCMVSPLASTPLHLLRLPVLVSSSACRGLCADQTSPEDDDHLHTYRSKAEHASLYSLAP